MMLRTKSWLAPATIAAIFAMAGSAPAADKKPAPERLPGVEGNYRIAKPYAPQPEPDDAPSEKARSWDVKVSGTLTVDIGAGSLPLPRN